MMETNVRYSATLLFTLLSVVYGFPAFGSEMAKTSSDGSCAAKGHMKGCCIGGGTECKVDIPSRESCYCDQTCFKEGTCCKDIYKIKCFAPNCTFKVLSPGGCPYPNTSCSTGLCYCDKLCHHYGDCCDDVPRAANCSDLQLNPGNCPYSNGSCSTGQCYCDKLCHRFKDCCKDVLSPPTRSTYPQMITTSKNNARFSQILREQILRNELLIRSQEILQELAYERAWNKMNRRINKDDSSE